jgi:adhesin/invasin
LSVPGLALSQLTVFAVGQPIQVSAFAASDEVPAARALYYLNPLGLYRLDLATNRLNPETPVPVTGSPVGLSFSGAAATGSPTQLILYNQSQSINAGETFRPLVVRAVDANGRPLYNVPVTFSTAASGVALSATSVNTNADGLAMTRVDPGTVTGRFTVTVQAGTLSATFSLAAGAGGGLPGAQGLQIKSGNGQVVREFGIAEPMVVVVRDPEGNPVPNVPITWELQEGVGTLQAFESATDANGEARAQFIGAAVPPGLSYQQARIRASTATEAVDFWVTTVLAFLPGQGIPAPAPLVVLVRPEQGVFNITGRAGETLTAAIEVRVVVQAGLQFGQPLPNVGLTAGTGNDPLTGVTAACVGGTVLTDENGSAKCDLKLGGVIGTANLLVNVGNIANYNFTLTVTPGLPARVNKLQGDGQTGKPGERLPLALLAEITDAFGNRLSGVPVQWSVSPSNAATLSSVVSTSDLRGRTSALVTLGQTPGQVQITVTAGSASATFTVTIEVTAAQLRKVSGDNQSAVINQAFAAPLVVQLLDAQNQPVPNAVVSFTVTSGSATLSSAAATTDAQGNAQVAVTAGASAGPIVVTASFGNLPPVTFNLTARLPGPSLTQGSFVNAASGAPGLAPGSIVKIVAPGMAPGVENNCVIPDARVGALPLALANVSVEFQAGSFSGFGPLYYVCNVNGEESAAVQVPFGLPVGTATVTVRAGGGSASISGVPVRPYQPGIFETVGSNGLRHGVLMRPDGSFVSQENPARRGEIVYLFATGLGAVTPAAATNAAGQGQTVNATVIVGVNNAGVRVLRAEYAVNMIGVYVVAFEVPADTTPGANRPLALAIFEGGQLIFGNGSSIPIQ